MEDLDEVFAALRPLLDRHAASLIVTTDEPGDVRMDCKRAGPSGTRLQFGALRRREDDVSFQFMPVFSHAVLLNEVGENLRAIMQARSIFNFTAEATTPELVAEMSTLVDAGLAAYRADKLA